jgi:hypothetical protein
MPAWRARRWHLLEGIGGFCYGSRETSFKEKSSADLAIGGCRWSVTGDGGRLLGRCVHGGCNAAAQRSTLSRRSRRRGNLRRQPRNLLCVRQGTRHPSDRRESSGQMRWLPRLSRMCRGPVRPMRRMRHSAVQMRMRCRHCWLRSLWLQLRKRLRALERLGLGQRLLVEAARHAGACPCACLGSSSSGPWGCKTQVARHGLQDTTCYGRL